MRRERWEKSRSNRLKGRKLCCRYILINASAGLEHKMDDVHLIRMIKTKDYLTSLTRAERTGRFIK